MHLSVHTDCFAPRPRDTVAHLRQHFDSLLRAIAVLGIAMVLGGMTLIADMAQRQGADAAPAHASHLVAPSNGAAVNLMHREVIGH